MHYDKAPIIEAHIALWVEPKAGISAVDIAGGLATLRDEYPERQEIPSEQWLFGPSLPPSVAAGPLLSGFRYISADKRRIVAARVDGVSFSLLYNPLSQEDRYDRWESFRDEARKIWEQYREGCRPLQVTRVAVRYINRFDLSEARIEMEDYFHAYPQEPLNLRHNHIADFVLQLLLRQPDIEADVVLKQSRVFPPRPDMISLILDIELVREQLNWSVGDDDTIWEYMEQLHVRKNEVFEACITDKAREVIR